MTTRRHTNGLILAPWRDRGAGHVVVVKQPHISLAGLLTAIEAHR
jgi:hypothetical protein